MSEPDLIQQLADRIESNRQEIQEGLGEKKDQFIELVKGFVSRMNPEKAALYIGLAYLGYQNLPFHSDMLKIVWGPVGIELAKTPNSGGQSGLLSLLGIVGVPVNSQVAGLSMLAYLGLESMPWEGINEQIYGTVSKTKEAYDIYHDALASYAQVMTEDERKTVDELYIKLQVAAKRGAFFGNEQTLLTAAGLIGYVESMIPTWEERLNENG